MFYYKDETKDFNSWIDFILEKAKKDKGICKNSPKIIIRRNNAQNKRTNKELVG